MPQFTWSTLMTANQLGLNPLAGSSHHPGTVYDNWQPYHCLLGQRDDPRENASPGRRDDRHDAVRAQHSGDLFPGRGR